MSFQNISQQINARNLDQNRNHNNITIVVVIRDYYKKMKNENETTFLLPISYG